LLAAIIRSHRRKFSQTLFNDLPSPWNTYAPYLTLVLRLAVLLHRNRHEHELPDFKIAIIKSKIYITFPSAWLTQSPLTHADLIQEADYLKSAGSSSNLPNRFFMKTLLRILMLLLSALVILCAMLVFFGVSNEPDIAVGWTLTRDDIARAKKILHEGSKTKPDEIGTIELTQPDLNLAANYLLNRYSKSAVKIEIKNNVLRFIVTMTLPRNSLGHYLNISFRLGNEDNSELPGLTKFKAGKLLLPAKFAAFVIDNIIRHTSLNDYFILATRPIKTVKIDQQKISITYYSNRETLIQARNFLTQSADNPSLKFISKNLPKSLLSMTPSGVYHWPIY